MAEEKKGLFARLKAGLGKTRDSFNEKIDNVFSVFKKLDDDLYDELEEALIMADIGGVTSACANASARSIYRTVKRQKESCTP